MTLTALPYHGGKSPARSTHRFIAGLLPQDTDVCYVEPFAGMLGVLLNRPKSAIEIANDLDRNIVSWWLAVRDYPDEFLRLVTLTPYSRDLHAQACEDLQRDDLTLLQRALATHIIIEQSRVKSLSSPKPYSWSRTLSTTAKSRTAITPITALAKRLRDVQLECRDACEILERTASIDNAVIYVDPPYIGRQGYGQVVDKDRLAKALLAQKGRVAISGYADEWNHLGWQQHSHQTLCIMQDGPYQQRTESLWTNYETAKLQLL